MSHDPDYAPRKMQALRQSNVQLRIKAQNTWQDYLKCKKQARSDEDLNRCKKMVELYDEIQNQRYKLRAEYAATAAESF